MDQRKVEEALTILCRIKEILKFDPRTEAQPRSRLEQAASELREFISYLAPSRVGKVHLNTELKKLLTTITSVQHAANVSADRMVKIMNGVLSNLDKLLDMLELKQGHIVAETENFDIAKDASRIIVARTEFEADHAKIVRRLQKRDTIFTFAPIAICVTTEINSSKLEAAGIRWVGISPVTIFMRQPVCITTKEPDMNAIIAQADEKWGARFMSVTHAINSRIQFLAVRGVKGSRGVWLMDKEVYRTLAPLGIKDVAFPF